MKALWMAALGLAAWQGSVLVSMEAERARKYHEAELHSQAMGKPLLVVGGPFGSTFSGKLFHFRAHGCGDLCLDLDARACQSCPTVVGDVRDIPFPDQYFGAAFVSHVLEHLPTVDDAKRAIEELYRVADQVWIVSPPKSSLYAWIIASHHLWIRQEEDRVLIQPFAKENHA